jgi:hypothetical protein
LCELRIRHISEYLVNRITSLDLRPGPASESVWDRSFTFAFSAAEHFIDSAIFGSMWRHGARRLQDPAAGSSFPDR